MTSLLAKASNRLRVSRVRVGLKDALMGRAAVAEASAERGTSLRGQRARRRCEVHSSSAARTETRRKLRESSLTEAAARSPIAANGGKAAFNKNTLGCGGASNGTQNPPTCTYTATALHGLLTEAAVRRAVQAGRFFSELRQDGASVRSAEEEEASLWVEAEYRELPSACFILSRRRGSWQQQRWKRGLQPEAFSQVSLASLSALFSPQDGSDGRFCQIRGLRSSAALSEETDSAKASLLLRSFLLNAGAGVSALAVSQEVGWAEAFSSVKATDAAPPSEEGGFVVLAVGVEDSSRPSSFDGEAAETEGAGCQTDENNSLCDPPSTEEASAAPSSTANAAGACDGGGRRFGHFQLWLLPSASWQAPTLRLLVQHEVCQKAFEEIRRRGGGGKSCKERPWR